MTWYEEMDLLFDWSRELIDVNSEKAKKVMKARTTMIIKRLDYMGKLV